MAKNVLWSEMRATAEKDGHVNWVSFFDERQMREIRFDELYARDFSHGTDGHNARLIIAQMAQMLEAMCSAVTIMFKDVQ